MAVPTVGEAVEYCLSGAVEARIDGQPIALGGPKQRCVLAVLLANHGAVVSVDRLIGLESRSAPRVAPARLPPEPAAR
jgi:hypothetical protein